MAKNKILASTLKSSLLLLSGSLLWSAASADILSTVDFEEGIQPINRDSSGHPALLSSKSGGSAGSIVVGAENGVTPRTGSFMMKSHVKRWTLPVRRNPDGSRLPDYRSEVAVTRRNQNFDGVFEFGKEYWLGVSVYIPADWSLDYGSALNGVARADRKAKGSILQIHDTAFNDGTWRYGIPFTVNHSKDGFHIWNRGNGCGNRGDSCLNNPNNRNQLKLFNEVAPMKKGQWNDFVMNFKWSPDADGFIKLWVNGNLELDSRGANYYNEHVEGPNGQPYFKMGLYQHSYMAPESVVFNVEERTLYHDELRIGGENSSFDEVSPNGVVTPDPVTPDPVTPVDTPVTDNTGLVLSNTDAQVSASKTVITWNTNAPTQGMVVFYANGVQPRHLKTSSLSTTGYLEIPDSYLVHNKTYTYYVKATDTNNESVQSQNFTFVTTD